jgi:hypothetical protein
MACNRILFLLVLDFLLIWLVIVLLFLLVLDFLLVGLVVLDFLLVRLLLDFLFIGLVLDLLLIGLVRFSARSQSEGREDGKCSDIFDCCNLTGKSGFYRY